MLNTAILKALLFTPAGRRPGGEWIWGIPIVYWGKPGIGKSAIIGQVVRMCGLKIFVILASIREPADFLGLPVPHDGKLVYMPPAWAHEAADCDMCVVFLDEVTTCAPATQAALLRVVLDRVVGDLQLPGGVRIVLAANPKEIAAGGRDLNAALANRMLHAETGDPPPEMWRNYMIGGGGDEDVEETLDPVSEQNRVLDEWPKEYALARGLAASFVRKNPSALFDMPKAKDPRASRAWASPRSLETMARVVAAAKIHGLGDIESDQMISMAVGERVAGDFAVFRSDLNTPDILDWLDGKVEWAHDPARPDISYVVYDGAAAFLKPNPQNDSDRELRRKRADRLWRHMESVVENTPDIAVVAGTTLAGAGLALGKNATRVMNKLMPIAQAAGII